MRSETCRANISVYLVGLRIYYKMIHGPYNTKTRGVFMFRSEIPFCIQIYHVIAEETDLHCHHHVSLIGKY